MGLEEIEKSVHLHESANEQGSLTVGRPLYIDLIRSLVRSKLFTQLQQYRLVLLRSRVPSCALTEGVASQTNGDSRLVRWLGDVVQHVTPIHRHIVLRNSSMAVVWCFKDGPSVNTNQL